MSGSTGARDGGDRHGLAGWFRFPRPRAALLASVVLALEALVLVALAVRGIVSLVHPQGDGSVPVAVALVVCAGLAAWVLLAGAWAIGLGRSWVRGIASTVQILGLLVAVSFFQGGLVALPSAIAVVSAAGLVGLFAPSVVEFTRREGSPFDED
ncbi:hypothetical protein [Sanguibacter suaedae]|uniref:Uncharacterized protein n=1 Tax=Sanguibacter suaedae TaxID=2795737 RepID=A0A934I364_9MICO|nr:hypothetical protein [Sanguibacter suaedae]MBI9114739.1 hypothetical protein [Sanguibacter suaedae]